MQGVRSMITALRTQTLISLREDPDKVSLHRWIIHFIEQSVQLKYFYLIIIVGLCDI